MKIMDDQLREYKIRLIQDYKEKKEKKQKKY